MDHVVLLVMASPSIMAAPGCKRTTRGVAMNLSEKRQ